MRISKPDRRHQGASAFLLALTFGLTVCAGYARGEELRLLRRYALQAEFKHVLGFDITRGGEIIVVDYAKPAILRFDQFGKQQQSYSQSGRHYCEIAGPKAIAATSNGFMVWDQTKHTLLRFGVDGECESETLGKNFETPGGALAWAGNRTIGGGSLMKFPLGRRCVFFSTDAQGTAEPSCLLWLDNDQLWLLYGREFVAATANTAYFMMPYEPVLYESSPPTSPARPIRLDGLTLPTPALPANYQSILSDRKRFFDFLASQSLVEGVAATAGGVVVATRTPGKQHRIDLRYYRRGSRSATAKAFLIIDPPSGGFPLHIRGDGNKQVYLLIAKGTFPSLHYEALVYEVR